MSIDVSTRILRSAGQRKGRAADYGVCAVGFVMAVVAIALAGCHRTAGQGGPANAAVDPSGYIAAPPTLTSASRGADGSVSLSGQAPNESEVRLRAPAGHAFSATTGEDGAWATQLPAAATPRMFAFEAGLGERVVHAEGAILTLPPPSAVAVLMRAGYGATLIGEVKGPLRIVAVDCDGAGGGSVSGVAPPGARVRLMLDGQPVSAGQADDEGRFTLLNLDARKPFASGSHLISVDSPTASVQGHVTVYPPAQLGDAAFRATRQPDAWRIDWRIPGGGSQTTLVFDPPAAAPASASEP